MLPVANSNRSSFSWGTSRCRPRSGMSAASNGFDRRMLIASASSQGVSERPLEEYPTTRPVTALIHFSGSRVTRQSDRFQAARHGLSGACPAPHLPRAGRTHFVSRLYGKAQAAILGLTALFRFMTRDEFFQQIRSSNAELLARQHLYSEDAHIFSGPAAYDAFRKRVIGFIRDVEFVAVVGSGNWRYSLNPDKDFREFGHHSDIDLAVISDAQFRRLWEEMRQNHRRHFYGLPNEEREQLRRNSENVYSGFISPEWIPRRDASSRHEYKRTLNALSDDSVRFLKVKMMFFKNVDEAVDYYARGFRRARKVIQ